MVKIAICFFGITRSLPYTISSIERNVIEPAKKFGNVSVYSHFFKQAEVTNPRSNEFGNLGTEDYRLLPNDWLLLEEPDNCLSQYGFEMLKAWGDSWDDDFKSLRNLVHQLHSLASVTDAALRDRAEIVAFCRPDLLYHDSLSDVIDKAVSFKSSVALLPYWEAHGGLNDRFAICKGDQAIISYGKRVRHMHEFCQNTYRPLHSEHLLAFSLVRGGVEVQRVANRASRIRLGGKKNYEDFSNSRFRNLKRTPAANFIRSLFYRIYRRRSIRTPPDQ